MRFVAVKTGDQQVALGQPPGQALHRIRSRLIKSRTALVNEVRGLLGEFGLVMPVQGVAACRRLTGWPRAIAEVLEDGENGLPGLMRQMLFQLAEEFTQRDQQIGELDDLIKQQCKADERIQRLLEIEGVGPITASAVVAAIGDAKQFTASRDLSAWVGLVPRQHSSGGKEQLGHITKRGDTYLRTLLIHGARAVVNACQNKTDRKSESIKGLITRRNKNIATVALANKHARIIWAVLSRGEAYRPARS